MTPDDFHYLCDMLKTRSGMVLTPEKQYLVEGRLAPLVREHGFDSVGALAAAVTRSDAETLRKQVTEAMTINESFFFRDKTPFEILADVMVPALAEARATARQMRVWCAAASTGQEPYSIAMKLKELEAKIPRWDVQILGTDISSDVLEKAKAGLYSQFEVQRGLPIQLLVKHFQQVGNLWQIDSAIRAMVQYRHFNLLDSFAGLGRFDIVFCRNVLIYFDAETKSDILDRIAKQLEPDGFLILGAAETVVGLNDSFKPVRGVRGLYIHADAEPPEVAAEPVAPVAAAATPATPPPMPATAALAREAS